jgi:hypothetical protein
MRHRSTSYQTLFVLLGLALVAFAPAGAAAPGLRLGSGFTFHGRLEQSAAPAQGRYDFELELYDRQEGGTLLGQQSLFDVPVKGGAFDLELDFGDALRSQPQAWLEVHVREAGFGAFTALEPRQPVSATSTTTCSIDNLVVEGKAGIGTNVLPLAELTLSVRGAESNGIDTAAAHIHSSAGGFSQDLFLDGDEIDSLTLGGAGPLHLNSNVPADVTLARGGGNVGVGIYDPEARLHVTGGTDAEPASGGFLVLGDVTGGNLALDSNEIMARNNGATATLFLNNDGGDVKVGGTLDVGYQMVVAYGCDFAGGQTASCPAGKRVVYGGCYSPFAQEELEASYPGDGFGESTTGWACRWDTCDDSSSTDYRTIAVCARVK